MAMGTKKRSRRRLPRNASTFQVSIPSRGASVLPVRERPPSMKNSWGNPSRIRYPRYARNTSLYSGSAKDLRMKNAPARRHRNPNGPKPMFSRAAMWGGTRWFS
jgi:hypothetical protein